MVPFGKSIKISNISDATSDDHCLALMLCSRMGPRQLRHCNGFWGGEEETDERGARRGVGVEGVEEEGCKGKEGRRRGGRDSVVVYMSA